LEEGVLKKAVALSLTPRRVHRLWDPVIPTSYLVFCCQTCSWSLCCEHRQEEDLQSVLSGKGNAVCGDREGIQLGTCNLQALSSSV